MGNSKHKWFDIQGKNREPADTNEVTYQGTNVNCQETTDVDTNFIVKRKRMGGRMTPRR